MSDPYRRYVNEAAGSLLVRLAESPDEIQAAQMLRYRVFYDERRATPTSAMEECKRDFDRFDDICDHLLMLDRQRGNGPEGVVGTYRFLRGAVAARYGGFYTADEYDITAIHNFAGEVLELGRSCIDAAYRHSAGMNLLWKAIAQYVRHHEIGLMFGCASLPGIDPNALALPLSFLHHYHLAPFELRPIAVVDRYVDMNRMPVEAIQLRKALISLPPLIKGYLRLGGFFGEGAVVDHQFNTTDVCVLVLTDKVTDKYIRHYTRDRGDEGIEGAL